MSNTILLPNHKVAKISAHGTTLAFENHWKLFKTYQEIIGLDGIDHFSINIADRKGEMAFLSYNPGMAYSAYLNKTYIYNGSISPTVYDKLDFYTWEEAHDPRFRENVTDIIQRKHGLDLGMIFTKKIAGFTLLYSFATRKNGEDFRLNGLENKSKFLQMGDHCLDQIKHIYQSYNPSFQVKSSVEKINPLKLVIDNVDKKVFA